MTTFDSHVYEWWFKNCLLEDLTANICAAESGIRHVIIYHDSATTHSVNSHLEWNPKLDDWGLRACEDFLHDYPGGLDGEVTIPETACGAQRPGDEDSLSVRKTWLQNACIDRLEEKDMWKTNLEEMLEVANGNETFRNHAGEGITFSLIRTPKKHPALNPIE